MLRVVAILVLAGAVSACGSSGDPCHAPRLVPAYLPRGVRIVQTEPFVPSAWATTWRIGAVMVQVAGDVNANLGDVGGRATVRGQPATYGETGIDEAPLAVTWTERVRCATRSDTAAYAVLGRGVSTGELVRITRSLRGP